MQKFERPRQFEVYRANPKGIGDINVLVLSDGILNALRSVIIVCSLDPLLESHDVNLPTYVLLPREETGLETEAVASPASPFTLPKNALVEKLSILPRKSQAKIDLALRLAFGYADWPL